MNKHLKIQIEKLLLEIAENVFFQTAEENAKTPYVVYNLEDAVFEDARTNYFLDVEVWDLFETTENIDALTKELKKIHKTSYIDEKIQFTIHLDRILNPKSNDRDWKRCTMRFEVRATERS